MRDRTKQMIASRRKADEKNFDNSRGIDERIDFVVTWVDGADPDWRQQKAKYQPLQEREKEADSEEARFRDWDLFRYFFRGIETFAPWVGKVHLVTCGQVPEWLHLESDKLHLVRHEEIMPKEVLPTFNSNAIELCLHKIEGLSERFVYFNDDIFLLAPVSKNYFFKQGKPCDLLAFQPIVANPENEVMSYLFLNNTIALARHFDKRENVKKQWKNYFHLGYPPLYFFYNILELFFPKFTGFYTVHGPVPFLKDTYLEVWEKENQWVRETVGQRFRSKKDLTIYLLREWQMLQGNFMPRNLHKEFQYFDIGKNHQKIAAAIRGRKKKIICINDTTKEMDVEEISRGLQQAFEELLPKKSSFEKD